MRILTTPVNQSTFYKRNPARRTSDLALLALSNRPSECRQSTVGKPPDRDRPPPTSAEASSKFTPIDLGPAPVPPVAPWCLVPLWWPPAYSAPWRIDTDIQDPREARGLAPREFQDESTISTMGIREVILPYRFLPCALHPSECFIFVSCGASFARAFPPREANCLPAESKRHS